MNLTIYVPKNWQKDSFDVWMHKIRTRLQKQRYDQLNDYPEMLRDKKVRILEDKIKETKTIKVNFELIKN